MHSALSRVATNRRGLVAAWLAVAIAGLVLGECRPLHVHAGEGVGLYNETHVLASLAVLNGDASPPSPGPAVGLPPAAVGSLPAPTATLAGIAGFAAASRAPPLP